MHPVHSLIHLQILNILSLISTKKNSVAVFHKLHKGEAWIVGPPVILQCAKDVKVRSIESLSPVDFEFQLYNIYIRPTLKISLFPLSDPGFQGMGR
jgi:hypothetical protein